MAHDPQAALLVLANLLIAIWISVEIARILRHADETTLRGALRDLHIETKEPVTAKTATVR